MLTKFESKSNRVKGLGFHPTRPWVLASLHSGIIQLWDYRIRTLLDKFDEHDGPVRGICFHHTQPLFVSGGDDYKIKVWNYKSRRCMFTLLGHLDYIRTVEFHRECPWILSSSDDQMIRIWNWQSRQSLVTLTGHNHYVMCASFHPKEDLVVSASLDLTVRVWDISGLRKKTVSIKPFPDNDSMRIQNEIFGNTDGVVKYILEGHDRGVNWAAFHPTSPLIVSGADDRQVKLWRMSDTKAWEVETFRGHFNNVSCVLFHPRQELILSNSEDKTIRVWDMAKRTGIQTFRREHDRFWILAAHPELNLFAAGHDSGMVIFKLERERPAYATHNNETVFFIKDKFVRSYDFASGREAPVLSVRRVPGNRTQTLSFSPQDRAILVSSDTEGGSYDLYQIPKDGRGAENVESKRGLGSSAVFVGRDRFAVLDKSNQIVVKNLKNEETKRCVPPHPVDLLFPGPTGCVLMRGEERISLYDVQQRKVLAELTTPFVKYAVWSTNGNTVALLGRDSIILANKRLEQLCTIHETIRIKSGAWDDNGVFIYTTLNHIKYCLPNGDNGIVRTLDTPIYVTAVRGNKVYCLDRESKNRVIAINPTEYLFKHALIDKRYNDVLRMVRESNLIGQSIISYLQKKGFPEVALHFVKDERTRFNLALECGNIAIALEAAEVLDDKECWHSLGIAALRQGNHQVVEMAYQRTKNYERLSFLYLITGNVEKLRKMLKIAEMRHDIMGRFHNALYLGDVDERIKILLESGQTPLAYISALTHDLSVEGLEEKTQALLEEANVEVPVPLSDAKLLFPPTPVMRAHGNWPLLTVSKGMLNLEEAGKFGVKETDVGAASWGADEDIDGDAVDVGDGSGWGEDIEPGEPAQTGEDAAAAEGDGWGFEDDGLEELDKIDAGPIKHAGDSFWTPPLPGSSFKQAWCNNSNLAADHVAAGSFESAMQLLNQQVGAVNFAPLKPHFIQLLVGSRASLPCTPSVPSLSEGLQRSGGYAKGRNTGLPQLFTGLPALVERLKVGYKATTEGKFSDALTHFLYIIHNLLLIVVDSKSEANEARELLGICREYVTGIRLELQRKELSTTKQDTSIRQAELAAYFTHCNLQPPHLILSLRSAMNCSYKVKNYSQAASFAKRLLELNPSSADFVTQARKVLKFAEQNPNNENAINYDERNPFVVCSISFTPIYRGSPMTKCPYCLASFKPEHNGKLCPTCQIAKIGAEAPGLTVFSGR